MGCGSSRQRPRRSVSVVPDLVFPAYCIRRASLNDTQAGLIADSWALCIQGTAAWRGRVDASNALSPLTAAVDSVAASDLTSARALRGITESPIAVFYDTFYGRLFEAYPAVRPLFKGSLVKQGRKLVTMIGLAVTLLRDVEKLVPELEDLARRHVAYGARVERYGPVGEVLLYSLERCCGPALWTPEVAAAWLTAYSVILEVMIPAATAEERAAASRNKRGGVLGLCGAHSATRHSATTASDGAAATTQAGTTRTGAYASAEQDPPTPSRSVTEGLQVPGSFSGASCPTSV